jgi:hypothetical protein
MKPKQNKITRKTIKRKTIKRNKTPLPMKGGDDRNDALRTISNNGLNLRVYKQFNNDKEIVLAAVSNEGMALQFASRQLQNDKEVVLAAVHQNGLSLRYADDFCEDKEVVLAAVHQNGLAIKWASLDLQNDKEVVLVAVNQDGLAFNHIYDLREDKEVILAAVSQNGLVLKNIIGKFRLDKDVVLAAVNEDGNSLVYANHFFDDDEIVFAAVKQNGMALQFASDRFKKDPYMVKLAMITYDEAFKFALTGRPPSLVRGESVTFTNQTNEGVCGRHVFPRVIIKNIFEVLYPLLVVNDIYTAHNCNKYLVTGKTIVDLNKLSIKECSKGGYIKILLFLHLFYLYQNYVPTVEDRPLGWLECTQVTHIYDKMYTPPFLPYLHKQIHTFMITNVLRDIKQKVDNLQIHLITFQIKTHLFETIEKVTKEGLYLMLRVENTTSSQKHSAHFLLVTGTHEGKILLKNSWGSEEVYAASLDEPIILDKYIWDTTTDCSFVIPVRGGEDIDDADIDSLDETLARFRELKSA